MKPIPAKCPNCDEVSIFLRDITLMVCTYAACSYYTFECPVCKLAVRWAANEHTIAMLLHAGVVAQVWEIPAEVFEPKDGPPLTEEDYLEFGLKLYGPNDHLVHQLVDLEKFECQV